MQAKRKYKDSVFRHMFNDKQRLQSLYKALSGRDVPIDEITINTLKGVFFNDIKNDLSFMAGNRMVILLEHQSSWNPNMPLRMLCYLAKLYQKMVDSRMPYTSQQVMIAAPEFYVLYNGEKQEPYYQQFKLSDAFLTKSNALELTVDSYNINYSKGNELLEACYELRCYSIFVAKVREGVKNGLTLSKSIRGAIHYCESHDLMKEYFLQNEREVFDMVSFKWDDKRALEVAKEDGEAIGEKRTVTRIVLSLLKKGKLSIADIADSAGISVEEVQKIARDNKLAF